MESTKSCHRPLLVPPQYVIPMFAMLFSLSLVFLLRLIPVSDGNYKSGDNRDLEEALKFLNTNNEESQRYCKQSSIVTWNYYTNLTDANKEAMLAFSKKNAEFNLKEWKKATSFAWKEFKNLNPSAYRRFKKLSVLDESVLPSDEYDELTRIIANMSEIYATAKVCSHGYTCDEPTLALEPDLTDIMAKSTDYDELERVWVAWRNATGKKMKDSYPRYVQLENKAATLNGFSDAGKLWTEGYESDHFSALLEKLWSELEPFYKQMHAYVRRKLMDVYPGKIKPDGPIPAHILGNMWSQSWDNIFRHLTPYPNEAEIGLTEAMKRKNMTPLEMFKTSETFFKSLDLLEMTPEFWSRSIIEKPKDREILRHAMAMDFCDGKDVRIKMCTEVNMEDLITVHHEMGHIEYYLQYKDQPQVFKNGANPGFHEAVGDTLALSVSTPKHLYTIGLLEELSENEIGLDINYQLKMALKKLAFLPFGYLIDLWRWDVFSGDISTSSMNTKWWEMRLKYQGICPPVKRTEEDFDPPAKFHVAASVPYVRYFVAHVLQFQFHKALCKEAGHEGPLHKCDIYRSENAGKLFSEVLSKGSSVTWNEAMSIMTKGETDQMDAFGFLEYFDPLIKWLEKENKNEFLGWKSDDPTQCP